MTERPLRLNRRAQTSILVQRSKRPFPPIPAISIRCPTAPLLCLSSSNRHCLGDSAIAGRRMDQRHPYPRHRQLGLAPGRASARPRARRGATFVTFACAELVERAGPRPALGPAKKSFVTANIGNIRAQPVRGTDEHEFRPQSVRDREAQPFPQAGEHRDDEPECRPHSVPFRDTVSPPRL